MGITSFHGTRGETVHRPSGYFVGNKDKVIEFYDDCTGIAHQVSETANISTWLVTDAGSGDSTGIYTVDDDGGVLTLTAAAAAGAEVTATTNSEFYQFNRRKRCRFECRFKVNRTDTAVFVGFAEGVAIGAAAATVEGLSHIGFLLDEDANLDFSFASDTSQTKTDTTVDVVADTYNTVAFEYDGKGTYRAWVDGTLRVTSTVTTTNPDDNMAAFLGIGNSTGNAGILTISHTYFRVEMDTP